MMAVDEFELQAPLMRLVRVTRRARLRRCRPARLPYPLFRDLSRDEQDTLAIAHQDLVGRLLRRFARQVPPQVDRGDLYGSGMLGLVEASRTFDPHLGFPFRRFASARIWGAMVDYLRKCDDLTRKQRQEVRDGQRLFFLLQLVLRGDRVVINEHGGEMTPPAESSPEPDPIRSRRIRTAVRSLSARERIILTGIYTHDQTHHDIGVTLGISGSRVGIIHAEALSKLRVSLADLER